MPCRVGIIGTGWGVNVQVPVFRSQGLEVTAIYSRSMDKARKLAEKNKIPHAFDSIDALCACADVDLVSVVSPTFLHAEHSVAVLRAGKHLLCDKPVAVGAPAAAALAAERDRHPKLHAIVDHEVRFLDATRAAAAAVRAGKIGAVRHAAATFHANMGGLGRNYGWWHQREKGGGVCSALGVHVVDLLHYVVGQKVASLSATCPIFLPTRPAKRGSTEMIKVSAEDMFAFVGQLEGGGAVTLSVNGAATGMAGQSVTVIGDKGNLTLDLDTLTCTVRDAKGKVVEKVTDKKTAPAAFIIGTQKLAAALGKAFGGDASALACASTLRDGVYTQAVIDACHRSSDTGGRQQVVVPGAKL